MAAYLERTGFSRLVPKVRKLLADLAERHDLTGYAWAAERIREAPITTARPGDDVYRYLTEADAAWRAPRLEAAEAEDRAARARLRAARARPRPPETPPAHVSDVLPSADLPPELARLPLRPPVAPPDPAILEARRAQAIALLRSGEASGAVAARLLVDYGISPEELAE